MHVQIINGNRFEMPLVDAAVTVEALRYQYDMCDVEERLDEENKRIASLFVTQPNQYASAKNIDPALYRDQVTLTKAEAKIAADALVYQYEYCDVEEGLDENNNRIAEIFFEAIRQE